jgi:hypothetical protein
MHVAQRLLELEVGVVLEPTREGGDDRRLVEAVAARAAHREHEREAELLVVGGVEALQVANSSSVHCARPALLCSWLIRG